MRIAVLFLLTSMALAQSPSAVAANESSASNLPSAQSLDELLKQVQASAQQSNIDIANLRIDKWKADGASKVQAQASSASIQRNLTYAVPDLVQRMQAAPNSLNANFRLYRNLNALYDTFSALAETAGAFGPKEQYSQLAADVARLDEIRHQVADRVDLLAGMNDAELARLRAQISAAAVAAKPAPKVVVDDEQPRPKKKSKAAPQPKQPPQ